MKTLIQASKRENPGRAVRVNYAPKDKSRVLYGPLQKPISLALDKQKIASVLAVAEAEDSRHGNPGELDTQKCQVMFKDIQRNPVTGDLVHIDFYAIQSGQKIVKEISVNLEGDPVGVREQGGALQFLTRFIKVKCLPMICRNS